LRVLVLKKEWEWFKEMQAESRTRQIEVSSYPRFTEGEIELEITEVNQSQDDCFLKRCLLCDDLCDPELHDCPQDHKAVRS